MTVPLQLKEEGAKIDCLTTANIVDVKKKDNLHILKAPKFTFSSEN